MEEVSGRGTERARVVTLAPCPFCGLTKFLRPAFRNGSLKGVSCWGRIVADNGTYEESCWYFGPSEGARSVEQANALWNNRGKPPEGRHGPWCHGGGCDGCLDGRRAYSQGPGDRSA